MSRRSSLWLFAALASLFACSGHTSDAAATDAAVDGTSSDATSAVDAPASADGGDGAVASPASGGAFFRLDAPTTGGGTCPDASATIQLSTKAPDGTDKLIADGFEGAVVRCTYDTVGFSVVVETKAGFGMFASGKFDAAGTAAQHATVKLLLPGASYSSSSAGCTITFQAKADGILAGRVLCPELDHSAIPGDMCSVSALDGMGASLSFFKFAGCGT